jgi:SAM-dependent methyltransferase
MTTQTCPHCGSAMDPIQMPMDSSWGGEIHHICFNDGCCYYTGSWSALEKQGIEGTGYRCRMDPRGTCGPAPVWSEDALKNLVMNADGQEPGSLDVFGKEDLSRDDETPDPEFYTKPRFVDHLDAVALATVEQLYGRLIGPRADILDLMAGPDSHLAAVKEPSSVIGLGMNQEELAANPVLSSYVLHDLNVNPLLPFGDDAFDAVVNTVSVDYLTQPVEVFREVARILRPGGLFIVVFSNRMFPPKAVNLWKTSTERCRVNLVRKYFSIPERFVIEGCYESTGKPRPQDDKYYELGIPSDPIYAVWGKVIKPEKHS